MDGAPSPSPLYSKLLGLSRSHATPTDIEEILSIRSPDARHSWGHKFLVSKNPGLQDSMDNEAFKSHILNSGVYLDTSSLEVHNIAIDEYQRKSTIHMSYFLKAKGGEEVLEHDLVWLLTFTDQMDVEGVLIKESVEFIDGAFGTSMSALIRGVHGHVSKGTRGSITLSQD